MKREINLLDEIKSDTERENYMRKWNIAIHSVFQKQSQDFALPQKAAWWFGVLCGACLLPIEYYYGSKAGGKSAILSVLFGTCTSISFSALFAKTAGDSFRRLVSSFYTPSSLRELYIKPWSEKKNRVWEMDYFTYSSSSINLSK
ncbi:MAG: hypothetical protein ACE365_03655 [Gammaproteobacteria bacterium]